MTDDNTVQLNTQIQIEAEKLRHHQYDRMQDITVTYGTLALKAMATISGGALVAIGAAFVNFIGMDNVQKHPAFPLVKDALSDAFTAFSTSMVLTLIGMFMLFFSRSAYLKASDFSRTYGKSKTFNEWMGVVFEYAAIFIVIAAFALVCWGLAQLALAFEHNSFAAKV